MHRTPTSHKGENGKVAVIGGSSFMHGAPIFSALAAEASGADLVYVSLPDRHQQVARMASLNFQVHPFRGDEIAADDIGPLLEMLATADAAVIGPGLARTTDAQRVTRELIESAPCPLVLDASALQSWTMQAIRGRGWTVTPHLGELERMGIAPDDIGRTAANMKTVILLKGHVDRIATTDGTVHDISGGNAGLTVGGTGDALAGLIAGMIAQGSKPADACHAASMVIKQAGTVLEREYGYAYGTRRVIDMIGRTLHGME